MEWLPALVLGVLLFVAVLLLVATFRDSGDRLRLSTCVSIAGGARRPKDTGGQDPIQHVVVLMLENRSFDHILGGLRHVDGASRERLNLDLQAQPVHPRPAHTL